MGTDVLTLDGATSEVEIKVKFRAWLVDTVESLKEANFDVVDATVQRSFTMREAATHLLCISLAHAKDRWSRGTVSLTTMGSFKHDFYSYVNERTGRSYSHQTIDNLIDVGATFFIAPPKGIEFPVVVPLYNAAGQTTGEIIDFDLFSIGVSKLVHAKSAVKRGLLNDRLDIWGQMMNPKVGVSSLLDTLRRVRGEAPSTDSVVDLPTNRYRIYFEGSLLMVQNGATEPEVLCEVNWEGIRDSPAIRQAWQTIVDSCAIRGWL